MHSRLASLPLIVPVLAGFLTIGFGVVGCTDSREGNTRAQPTVKSIKQSRAEIVEAKNEIGKATASLTMILHQADLKQSYESFSDSVEKIKDREEDVKSQREKMQKDGDEYIKEWQTEVAQFSNDDLKKASIDRQAAVKKHFAETTAAYKELDDVYEPFITNLTEIKKSLANDLTPDAVKVVKPTAETAISDGDKVQGKAQDLIQRLDELSASLSSIDPNAAK